MDNRAGFGEVVSNAVNIFSTNSIGGEDNSKKQQLGKTAKLHPKRSRLHDGYGKND